MVKRLSVEDNYKLKTSCLTLTNAIISSPRSLDFRMHLRNEFIRQGLGLAVEVVDYSSIFRLILSY